MSSINLLPRNLRDEDGQNEQKMITALSVLLVVASIIFSVVIYASKTIAMDKLDSLDAESEKIDNDIEKAINGSELFLVRDRVKDIVSLIDDHRYFSKALKVVQGVVTDDVYLSENNFSLDGDGSLVLEISGIAKNYQSAVNQIAVFKNSYWINKVNIGNISSDENGETNFSGELELKKNLVLYHKYYWDIGIVLLSSKVDRDLIINEYSAVLKKYGDEDIVEIKFSGIAYDEEKLIALKDGLKQSGTFIKDVDVFYDLNKKETSGTIKFNGEIKLKF